MQGHILVYGAGGKGRQVANFLLSHGYDVIGFADRKAHPDDRLADLPVLTVDDWTSRIDVGTTTLVVAVHNHLTSVGELIQALNRYPFERIVTPVEFHAIFDGLVPDHYWLTSPATYSGKDEQFSFLRSLFTDDVSRDLLERIIQFRISGNYEHIPWPSTDDQYCPTNLPRWPEPIRFVDCGAYDGDTVRSLLSHGYTFSAIAAFEPDYANYRRLARTIETIPSSVCFPCTVGATTCLQSFEASGDMAGQVTPGAGTTVQCVALDEALCGFQPTLIKMDIEGAELDALRGAKSLICNSQAALAISIYHRPADLWEIPRLLTSWQLEHSYHLRCHGHNTFDLVLYAIPKQAR